MTAGESAVEFVRYILESLCEQKDAIVVEESQDDLGILVSIQVSNDDMGRLIGKQGQNISALRTLVRVIGSRHEERINIKVQEPAA